MISATLRKRPVGSQSDMMDIVERLRRLASQQDMLTCEELLKAADEIERLRARDRSP